MGVIPERGPPSRPESMRAALTGGLPVPRRESHLAMKLLRNRWVRRTGLTLGVILLLVVLAVTSTWFGLRNRGLEHRSRVLAELDATSPGWRIDDIQAARRIAAPEGNAAEQAVRLRDRFPPGYRDWQKKLTRYYEPHPGCLPCEEELALSREVADLCREQVAEARNLRHLSGGGIAIVINPNVVGTTLPHLDKIRTVAALLQHDALVSAADGRGDDALDDVLAVLALARGIGDEPFLISQLVRMALASIAVKATERTLWLCEPKEAKLAEVQAALAAEAAVPRLLYGLRGERGAMNLLAENLDNGTLEVTRTVEGLTDSKLPPGALTSVPARALLPEVQARYLELMNRAIAAAEKPHGPDRADEFKAIEDDIKTEGDLAQAALRRVYPAVSRCHDSDVRVTALLHAATAAVAAERYRHHTKSYPTGWGEWLTPPVDPFTAKPLLFKPTDTGVVIYSAGPDRTDDGGKLSDTSLPPKGTDLGFRLFAPPHRRQPPKPEPEK